MRSVLLCGTNTISIDVMHKFVNKVNVRSSVVDFSFCPDYVNQSSRPRLVSDMVDEATKTGQLPNSSFLSPLSTYTEDIDSLDVEVVGDDKIDSYGRAQAVMDFVDRKEKEVKSKKDALKEASDKAENELIESRIKKASVTSPVE